MSASTETTITEAKCTECGEWSRIAPTGPVLAAVDFDESGDPVAGLVHGPWWWTDDNGDANNGPAGCPNCGAIQCPESECDHRERTPTPITSAETDITVRVRALLDSGKLRWMPGMFDAGYSARCIEGESADDRLVRWTKRHGLTDYVELEGDEQPDIYDAATLGCMLAQAREAQVNHCRVRPQDEVVLTVERVRGGWRWRLSICCIDGGGDDSVGTADLGRIVGTEAEAIIEAREAAP